VPTTVNMVAATSAPRAFPARDRCLATESSTIPAMTRPLVLGIGFSIREPLAEMPLRYAGDELAAQVLTGVVLIY